MGVDPQEGVDASLASGFEGVRKAVKSVSREGWSAGQVLEQVRLESTAAVHLLMG